MTEQVVEYWQDKVGQLIRETGDAVAVNRDNWLFTPAMLETMVVNTVTDHEIMYALEFIEDNELEVFKREDLFFGAPTVEFDGFKLTKNCIRLLYQFARLYDLSPRLQSGINSVIEWGGGFGNMAQIVNEVCDVDFYCIMDLPGMNILQKRYLEAYIDKCGVDKKIYVNEIPEDGKGFALLDVNHIDLINDRSYDLFISTFALSETGRDLVSRVIDSNFFSSELLLVTVQNENMIFPAISKLRRYLNSYCDLSEIYHLGFPGQDNVKIYFKTGE